MSLLVDKPHLKIARLGRYGTVRWLCMCKSMRAKGYGRTPTEAYAHFLNKYSWHLRSKS